MPTIYNKRGTKYSLSILNPILGSGELCLEIDTNRIKFGDGNSNWNSLPYAIIPSGTSNGQFLQYSVPSGTWFPSSSGNFTTLQVNGTGVSISGHTHTSSDITNFNSSVSGLLPSVSGSGYTVSTFANNIYTISVTGLQPSGNYSVVGHTHTSSNITDFTEAVQDVVGASGFLIGASGITISYNDVSNTLTVTAGETATISNIGDNRVLTSNGTSTGIDAESTLTFDGCRLRIDCANPSGSAGVDLIGDGKSASIISNVYNNTSNDNTTNRLIFLGAKGSLSTPSGLDINDTMFIIRGDGYNPYGTLTSLGTLDNRTSRIRGYISSSGTHYLGSSLEFNTSSGGSGLYDRSMIFDHSGSLKINNIAVSLSGHTHTLSDITDFNVTVSGLFPTIANSGDNRILTSTGSSTGINAESNLTFDGSTLNIDGNLVFDSFTESVVAIGNSSTSRTISLSSGTVQTCTLTGNCAFTMPTTSAGKSFTMFLNTGSGNYTASFSGVLWSDSAPPTITTIGSKVDILSFISDGSYWYGSYSQNYG